MFNKLPLTLILSVQELYLGKASSSQPGFTAEPPGISTTTERLGLLPRECPIGLVSKLDIRDFEHLYFKNFKLTEKLQLRYK